MMLSGKMRVGSYMTMDYEFSGTRLMAGAIIPVTWMLTVNIAVPDKKKLDKSEIDRAATVAYQRLAFFLDTNLQNVVMVDVGNELDMFIGNTCRNITMFCPGPAYDDLILRMLHAKLTELSIGTLYIGEMSLKSSDMSVKYTYDCVDGDYNLPMETKEYIPVSCIIRDELAWWMRDDGFCFEFLAPNPEEGEKDTSADIFSEIVDPMTEFDQIIQEIDDESEREPAKIVSVDRWKPKKI